MSKIVVAEIEGPSTTSNKITIATGSQLDLVGSTGTVTLDAADITAGSIPNARLAAGTIVQVIQTVKTDIWNGTSNGTEIALASMSCSITPTSSSSKVLIQVSLSYSCNATTYKLRIKRGSTLIGQGDASGSRQQGMTGLGYTTDANQVDSGCFMYLDSPGTTSAVTYSLYTINDNTGPLYVNRSKTDSNTATGGRSSSTITLMEVKA